ncbi:hypothetical protein ONQ62_26275, partial [Salmonella enterica subsp. enterica serovar Virginia]|nr:hypothetical protein [Salmonella enterica subsp. enterica serovar Virginia]
LVVTVDPAVKALNNATFGKSYEKTITTRDVQPSVGFASRGSLVVKTHHIFHPFTVVKRRLTVAVGTGYRQFIVRVDSARMFTVH